MDNEAVQKLMGLLLAVGNYMNSGIYFTTVALQWLEISAKLATVTVSVCSSIQ